MRNRILTTVVIAIAIFGLCRCCNDDEDTISVPKRVQTESQDSIDNKYISEKKSIPNEIFGKVHAELTKNTYGSEIIATSNGFPVWTDYVYKQTRSVGNGIVIFKEKIPEDGEEPEYREHRWYPDGHQNEYYMETRDLQDIINYATAHKDYIECSLTIINSSELNTEYPYGGYRDIMDAYSKVAEWNNYVPIAAERLVSAYGDVYCIINSNDRGPDSDELSVIIYRDGSVDMFLGAMSYNEFRSEILHITPDNHTIAKSKYSEEHGHYNDYYIDTNLSYWIHAYAQEHVEDQEFISQFSCRPFFEHL